MRFVAVVLTTVVLLSLAGAASAQITFLNSYNLGNGDERIGFQRIGVTRGAQSYAYWDTEIIQASLNRINGVSSVTVVTPNGATKDSNAFLRDPWLNTGLDLGVGNGTSFGAGDQWVQVTFDKPIVNSTGPDGFIAGLQFLWVTPNLSPMIISTSPGNSFVFPTSGGFNGSVTDPLEQYTYTQPVALPADLLSASQTPSGSLIQPTHVLQTFDLSSMGVPAGGSVSSLYLQDWSGNGNGVTATFIAGFPAVPEPASLGLLSVGLLALGRRRR